MISDWLIDFLFQIPFPNKFKIVHMDIPIVQHTDTATGQIRENVVFCADILDALTQDFFARKGNPVEEPPHMDEVKVTKMDYSKMRIRVNFINTFWY